MSERRDHAEGPRQAHAQRAARAARLVQERRQRRMAVRAGRRRGSRSTSCASSTRDVPVMALGLGSNLIVRDGGVPGVVVRLGKPFAKIEQLDETTLRCGGGASGILVSSTARDAGIAGLEFLRGIPGTVGGFVRMNGGAYGREVKDILVSARARAALGRGRRMAARQASATPIATAKCRKARSSSTRLSRASPAIPRRSARRWTRSPAPRGIAAAAQPHRRLDLQEPAGPQGVGADRRGRLPRADAWATPKSRKSIAISCSISVARRAPRSRRWARKSAAGWRRRLNITLEWEIQRVGSE